MLSNPVCPPGAARNSGLGSWAVLPPPPCLHQLPGHRDDQVCVCFSYICGAAASLLWKRKRKRRVSSRHCSSDLILAPFFCTRCFCCRT